MDLTVSSVRKRQVIDITEQVEARLGDHTGVVVIFVQHTTAAVTTADLDPGTDEDLLDALGNLIPDQTWRHPHDPAHAPDHLLTSIVGTSLSVPAANGKLQLGAWQRVVVIDFDGPRERRIKLSLLGTLQ